MKNNKLITWIVGLFTFLLILHSCEDSLDGTTFTTTDEMTIIGTLESNPEKFSLYIEVLEKTGFYTAFQSYGNYTCFAPTNEAILEFIQDTYNVNSVDDITSDDQIEFLKTVVQFHTLARERLTSTFIEGRLPDTTYTGDFLTTSFVEGGGIANLTINKEVKLDQYDIDTNNGVIHAVNGVLDPFIDPIPKVMEENGKHTIFVEALKQTGFYDLLSVIFDERGARNSFTVLAESDEVYAENGINSFTDLVSLISPDDSDFMDPNNDLNRYVGYHATESFLYSADFPNDGFISTITPQNAIKSFKTDTELRINEDGTGSDAIWTSLITAESNIPTKNGVYHTVNKLFRIFTPKPQRIIFDFATSQPEMQSGTVGFFTWYDDPETFSKLRIFPWTRIRVLANGTNAAYDRRSVLNLGSVTYIEFDTPVLPKGKYELRVCGNQGNNGRPVFQTYWDGQPIGSQWDMRSNPSELGIGWPNEDSLELRSRGWLRGLKDVTDNSGNSAYDSPNWARFIVTDELLMSEQKSHVLRFELIRSGGIPIDYAEFVPVD